MMPRRSLVLALPFLLAACGEPMSALDGGPSDGGPVDLDAGPSAAPFDPYLALADPDLLARRLPGAARLATSRALDDPDTGDDNHDWSHFVRVEETPDGPEAVLLDERGPGFISRFWFTSRIGEDHVSGNDARLHIYLDGEELDFGEGDGARGITLGRLVSGELDGLGFPWVSGMQMSSGSHIMNLPIAFARSAKVTLDHIPERVTFYQIDWRSLPANTPVETFSGTLGPEQRAALSTAADRWSGLTPGVEITESFEIAPGASQRISHREATVLRELGYRLSAGSAASAELSVTIDGEEAMAGPLDRLLFAADPTDACRAALSDASGSGDRGALRYSAPVEDEVVVELHNRGTDPLIGQWRFVHDAEADRSGLGRLHAQCRQSTAVLGDHIETLRVSGRGHYAGIYLVMRAGEGWGWWMMEGDHEFQVDGEWALLGTGVEDSFGGAFYYMDGPFCLPLHGAPGYDLMGQGHLIARHIDVAQYRHHQLDTLNFEDEIALRFEAYEPETSFESCAFYYLDD